MPEEHVQKRTSSTSLLKTVPSRICTKYDKVYEEGPFSKRVVYIKKKSQENRSSPYDTTSISPSICGFLKDCTEAAAVNGNHQQRLHGGKQPQIVNIVPSLTDCAKQFKQQQPTKVEVSMEERIKPSVIHVHLQEYTPVNRSWDNFSRCIQSKEKMRPHKMNRGTQTLYRESSAQTLPYLPPVSNDKEILETLELFKLPKILKGDGPPGLNEVEILERARKRWAFEKSIKREFECKMKEARTQLARKKHFTKHKHVIDAFEWENWLQREEAIQSYQMMRFKLVICIFERREREMHEKSNMRISMMCKEIIGKRDKALKQSAIDYDRQMRRLKIEHERKPRNWRKEKISFELGDPSSEYYGPQMRYGVNPNRRHFELSRKAFEMRMEDLEKRSVDMKKLECPFAKLKAWSKPKEKKPEIEQNFCTDTNLKKLYESLKGLREHSKKQKIIPKCLKEKAKILEPVVSVDDEVVIEEFEFDGEDEVEDIEVDDESVQVDASFSQNSLKEMYSQRDGNMVDLAEILDERRREELEAMLAEYEGTKIGWLMRFLSEEMGRLQEQRKLHFITMLAQKERWRREAAEAGLRQKENEMRRIYEDIFDETDRANYDVCEQYLDNIFGIDTREQADYEAAHSVTALAKVIDDDLQRWVNSFKLIQHPLNYDELRCLLRDLVFPENLVDCLALRYEATSCADYIINDVLFPNIFSLLEPYDVVFPLTSEMIDRLIDNDLYLFSSECSSSCDCSEICDCTPEDLEAKAIMRKLIRQAVPGRRWRTSTERIADESARDIVDMVCANVTVSKRCAFVPGARRKRPTIKKIPSEINLLARKTASQTAALQYQPMNATSSAESSRIDTFRIVKYRKDRQQARDSCTKSLSSVHRPVYIKSDVMGLSGSVLLDKKKLQTPRESSTDDLRTSLLKKIKSAIDIHAIGSDNTGDDFSSESNDEFERITGTHRHDRRPSQSFVRAICQDVVESILQPDEFYADLIKKVIADTIESRSAIEEDITSTDLETERITKFEGEEWTDYKVETDIERGTSEHTMVLYEEELKRILQDDEECKCQQEIDYINHIRELYKNGKIKVICKEPRVKEPVAQALSVDSELLAMDLAEMTFEYEASPDKTTDFDQDYFFNVPEGETFDDEEMEDVQTEYATEAAQLVKAEQEAADTAEQDLAVTTEAVAEVVQEDGTPEQPAESKEPVVDTAEASAGPVEEQEVIEATTTDVQPIEEAKEEEQLEENIEEVKEEEQPQENIEEAKEEEQPEENIEEAKEEENPQENIEDAGPDA